ncbi:hypothetical protein COOONC_14759, partial [Cooperia oncophora]
MYRLLQIFGKGTRHNSRSQSCPKNATEKETRLMSSIVVSRRRSGRDKRDVIMISTKHDATRNDAGKPEVVIDYNAGKSFIDLSDQMASYCPFQRKTYKWYLRIFFHLVCQCAVTNAWTLMKQHRRCSLPITEFKKDIVRELLSKNPLKRKKHYLCKPDGSGRKPSRRCIGCYRSLAKAHGTTHARNHAPR